MPLSHHQKLQNHPFPIVINDQVIKPIGQGHPALIHQGNLQIVKPGWNIGDGLVLNLPKRKGEYPVVDIGSSSQG